MLNARVIAGLDAERFAATAVPRDVAFFVPFRALPVGARDVLARREHGRPMLVATNVSFSLHRAVNNVVEILSRLVVRRNDKGRLRILDVFVGDGGQPLLTRTDFVHAALPVQVFDRTTYVAA